MWSICRSSWNPLLLNNLHISIYLRTGFGLGLLICDSSDRLFLCSVSGSKASIFVRKALHIRLRDRNMRSVLLARREGYALFDEDDVCAGT